MKPIKKFLNDALKCFEEILEYIPIGHSVAQKFVVDGKTVEVKIEFKME